MNTGRIAVLWMLCLLSSSLLAWGAVGKGRLSGKVKGEDGKPLKGAEVILTNTDAGVEYKLTTDKKGKYAHPMVAATSPDVEPAAQTPRFHTLDCKA